jgi:hypothetical protein
MLGAIPKQSLVVLSFPEGAVLPFALQSPFTSTDLYSQQRIIAFPPMCGWPLPARLETGAHARIPFAGQGRPLYTADGLSGGVEEIDTLGKQVCASRPVV